uniref:Coiled-coil domain containing 174 n=1 Tax=Oncorhynchus tshawytscha TaxID=74940 RepID=A0AAZ3PSE5_ONCTS
DKKRENHADQDFQGKGLFIEEDVSDNTVLSFFLMFVHRRDPAEKDRLSEDMRRELQRQVWEREEAMNSPVGRIHYEDIGEQLLSLILLPSEDDEAHEEAPAVKKLEVEIQERRDTKSGVPHVREWDRGKVDFFGKWTSRRQDDRESEFTPPSVYFSDDKRQGYGKWAKREQDRPKMAFMWSEGQGGGHSHPRPSPKVVLYPSPSQVPLYPLNPQCYSLTTAQRSTP